MSRWRPFCFSDFVENQYHASYRPILHAYEVLWWYLWNRYFYRVYKLSVGNVSIVAINVAMAAILFFRFCWKSIPFILWGFSTCLWSFVVISFKLLRLEGVQGQCWKCVQRRNKCRDGGHFVFRILSKINNIHPIALFYMPIKFREKIWRTVRFRGCTSKVAHASRLTPDGNCTTAICPPNYKNSHLCMFKCMSFIYCWNVMIPLYVIA